MNQTVSRSVVSRLLSVATVLTLVGFAASVDLQPQSALASPGASADLGASVSYMEDDNNGNGDENRDGNGNDNRNNDENNNDENRNEDENQNNENNENNENTGGEGIFSTICSVPGFATNAGCATGLLGN
jgi:hypothetical protein